MKVCLSPAFCVKQGTIRSNFRILESTAKFRVTLILNRPPSTLQDPDAFKPIIRNLVSRQLEYFGQGATEIFVLESRQDNGKLTITYFKKITRLQAIQVRRQSFCHV